MYYSKITGTGSYLPSRIITNADLEKMVDTSDAWITERTGIKTRRLSDTTKNEFTSDMAAYAGKKAIEAAGLTPNDIDLIILGTVCPDMKLPSTSSLVQQKIGITNQCPAVDLVAACTGFIYGMVFADAMIKSGMHKNILVIGTEMLSNFTNWEDRTTCVLFADGAGAFVISQSSDPASQFLSSTIACDGTGAEYLYIKHGGVVHPTTKESIDAKGESIMMEGRQVFKYATRTMISNMQTVIEKAGLKSDDLSWVLPHQANLRIIEYIADKLAMPMEKVLVTVDKYGNNSSATIPIAFDEAVRDGRIKRGQKIGLVAFGAGVTSGAVMVQY